MEKNIADQLMKMDMLGLSKLEKHEHSKKVGPRTLARTLAFNLALTLAFTLAFTLARTLAFTLAHTLALTLRAPGGSLPTLLRLR